MTAHTLSNHTWVSLSPEQRNRIRVAFNIPRSGNTDVNDGVIVSDGTTPQDLGHLTIEKMQTYLGDTSTDFHKLFDRVVARIQDEIEGKGIVVNITPEVAKEISKPGEVVIPKKRGRPAKSNG